MSETTSDFTSPYTDEGGFPIWEPSITDLKSYKHFDAVISPEKIIELVRDPLLVAKHSFRPLLHFRKEWRRAPIKDKNTGELVQRAPKGRDIRYACRKDAYIYKHYRTLLSSRYERQLENADLSQSVLAYRRILSPERKGACKSNIDFADDAFQAIEGLGRCCAVAIDIKDYFGSINHQRLKDVWAELLGQSRISDDHYAVFKSVTDYRYVDLTSAFVALGYSKFDEKGKPRFLVKPSKIPTQICTPEEYKNSIIGKGLVKRHDKKCGIPQGTPISDLLANAYLFDFDVKMNLYAQERGGRYFRYSDDILLILPGDGRTARGIINRVGHEIKKCGDELIIHPDKTEVVCFASSNRKRRCYSLVLTENPTIRKRGLSNEGLSYLGFRFDGKGVYLRNSTITNLRGKIARTCKAIAFQHVHGHPEKDLQWLIEKMPIDEIKRKYLRVEDFVDVVRIARLEGKPPFESMTFFSYVKKAEGIFKKRGGHLMRQLREIEPTIERLLVREIEAKYQIYVAIIAVRNSQEGVN